MCKSLCVYQCINNRKEGSTHLLWASRAALMEQREGGHTIASQLNCYAIAGMMQDQARKWELGSYSLSWKMQNIAEVSGESPGIRFKSCHYKSPSAKQFVQQLITAVKQRSHGAILRTEGKAVATGERRLGDKSKANMPKLIGQKGSTSLQSWLRGRKRQNVGYEWINMWGHLHEQSHWNLSSSFSACLNRWGFQLLSGGRILALMPSDCAGATFYKLNKANANRFTWGKLYL